MCGIIAITGKNIDEIKDLEIGTMLSCLSSRGPDEHDFAKYSESILGQTRLSIVDIKQGHQPMRDNARALTIVFNGEIYGYKDLRDDLIKKGHKFSTNSDTEVILKSYVEYGKDCLRHIDGMFAFALWDDEKKELFIARDRFGKKPFYYTFIDGVFFAASEMKAIFATGRIKGQIDCGALDDYLRLTYIPPNKTIYKNIETLLPAHAGIIKDGKIEIWKYWELKKQELDISYEEAKTKLKVLFDEAVRKRMIADVEIGSLLSGGIDSTIVTLYAQKYSKTKIKTFSVGYDGAKNELPFALEVSKKIGTDHYTLDVKADLINELKKIIEYMDEPHADSSNFPQALISGLASSKVKVALSGDGADELFMGYGWYQKYWHTPRWKISRLFNDSFKAQQKEITVFDKNERWKLLKRKPSKDGDFENKVVKNIFNPIEKINTFDLYVYLPGQLLTKIDRTSMMHSLEVRSPFLDTALAEFVYNLPIKFKLSKEKNKIILKDILTESFPKEFVYRRKQGFGAPIETWLKDENMRIFVKNILENDNGMYKFIDKNQTIKVLNDFYLKKIGDPRKIWSLVCLALWFNLHQKNYG